MEDCCIIFIVHHKNGFIFYRELTSAHDVNLQGTGNVGTSLQLLGGVDTVHDFPSTYCKTRKNTLPHCLADHGQTIQSLAKCGSCHCIFRLLQTFLPLFSWKMIVNLNNQSGSQYLTEWLLIYFSDEIVRFFYCKINHRSQQPHESANKIICAIISACYFALK